jgi:hypothetical protein
MHGDYFLDIYDRILHSYIYEEIECEHPDINTVIPDSHHFTGRQGLLPYMLPYIWKGF